MEIKYLSLQDVLAIHKKVILPGEFGGVDKEGALDSILCHIQYYYPDFEDKLTHLFFQINKGHCFQNANKRTAIAASQEFLNINNIPVEKFFDMFENIAIAVAANIVNKELLKEILVAFINDDLDEKEWLKLELVNIVEKVAELQENEN